MRRILTWILAAAAIVGIAVALLLPARGDYTERSQVAEALSLMSNARAPLAEHFGNEQRWPAALPEAVPRQGKFTRSVRITKGAGEAGPIELTATLGTDGVRSAVAGRTVVMSSADGGLTWSCRAGTVDVRFMPSLCR